MSEDEVNEVGTVVFDQVITAQDLYLGSKKEITAGVKAAVELGVEELEKKLKNPAYRAQIKALGHAPARELRVTVTLIEADPQTQYAPDPAPKAAAPAADPSKAAA